MSTRTIAASGIGYAAAGVPAPPITEFDQLLASANAVLALANGKATGRTDSAALSANMLANGTFTGGITGWTAAGGWAYGTNNAVFTVTGGDADLTHDATLAVTSGKRYLVEFDVTHSVHTNGELTVHLGTVNDRVDIKRSNTTYKAGVWLTANTTGSVSFKIAGARVGTATGTITIDNVQVREFTTAIVPYQTIYDTDDAARIEFRVHDGDILGIGVDALSNWVDDGQSQGLIAIGARAMRYHAIGAYCVAIGVECLENNATGGSNIAIGYRALRANTCGYRNLAIGSNALGAALRGANNLAIGDSALTAATLPTHCIAIGTNAMQTATGNSITAVGADACRTITGDYNVAVGTGVLAVALDATQNTGVGYLALTALTSGDGNTAIGNGALAAATTGSGNTIIGNGAGPALVGGGDNVVIGQYTTVGASAYYNVVVGRSAGSTAFVGANNTGSVLLGARAGSTETSGSITNRLMIDNQARTADKGWYESLIVGTFAADLSGQGVRINGFITTGGGSLIAASPYDAMNAGLTRKWSEAVGTAAAAASTISIAVNVPTGCKLLAAQLRVEIALGQTWSAAYAGGSTQAIITTGTAAAKNTKVNKFFDPNAATPITSNTTTITITADAGNFTEGSQVRAIVFFEALETLADKP